MKITIPPRICYHIQGVVGEGEQKKIRAEAQRQVGLLRSGMAFQGLSQGRMQHRCGGYEFRSTSVFGLESVDVWMAGGAEKAKKGPVAIVPCWCTYQLAEGFVTRVIESNPTSDCLPVYSIEYPECALNDVSVFEGTRYEVEVCRCDVFGKKKGTRLLYICVTTDFRTFEVNDHVCVMYIEAWDIEAFEDEEEEASYMVCELDDCACNVEPRDKEFDTVVDALDGDFIILPYLIISEEL